jgi:hypothetical protein
MLEPAPILPAWRWSHSSVFGGVMIVIALMKRRDQTEHRLS